MSSKNNSENKIEALQEKLQSIKGREEITGYILRGPNSASIDLKDPTRIVDYAILSSTAFEAGNSISTILEIGEVDSIITEGEDIKITSKAVNDHSLSIFMEKNVDHNKLFKELNLK
jgi:predicted regulator of Ras-like GTPase activity (Roadblock/LC7/MglB family)